MTKSIDVSRAEGYKAKLDEARSKRNGLNSVVYGSGNYAGTNLSTDICLVSTYLDYLARTYPYQTPPRNPLLFPDLFPPNTTTTTVQQQTFNLFNAKVREARAHATNVTNVRNHWIKRKEFLQTVKTALYYWKDWNISVREYIEHGIIQNHHDSLMSVGYSHNNHDMNIRADSLPEYFEVVKNYRLYGEGCKVQAAQAAETIKSREANKAIRELNTFIDTCKNNRAKAREAIESLKGEEQTINAVIAHASRVITQLNNFGG